MHLVLMTRGIHHMVEQWKDLMQAQRFAWKRKNLDTGKEELTIVQGALRPIQFWEYIFPEECLGDVLKGMQISGPIIRPEVKNFAWMLRKVLRLQNIPSMEEINKMTQVGYIPLGTLNDKQMPPLPVHTMFMEGVAVYPVGTRKDPKQDYDWKEHGRYHQEGL